MAAIMSNMQSLQRFFKKYKSHIFIGLIVLLALRVFVPQLDQLQDSITALKEANLAWMMAGLIVFFIGIPVLSWQFMVLALQPLRFPLTLRVETAGLFVSKLLPSSLGTISLNYYYFIKSKHSGVQAGTVLAMNGITSGTAYAILILIALLLNDFNTNNVINEVSVPIGLITACVVGLIIIGVVVYNIPRFRHKISTTLRSVSHNIKAYKTRPWSIFLAVLYNGIGTCTSLFALYASAHAIGVDINFAQTMLAYTLGNIAAGLVPTPGGLGAAEAGIYAGLSMVGVESTSALTTTLLYRLITYWLPIIPGYLSFTSLRRDLLAGFKIKQSRPEPKL